MSATPEPSTEATVSLTDIVEESEVERELEEDARAVLGNSDNEHCSYDKGYVKRQALYACNTCRAGRKDAESRAGICLACSYACHDGHDLVELYTKRDFRCDCGNDNFPDLECKLRPRKDARNDSNSYDQNYDGLYCTCSRPYPDPDSDVADEMIQCVVCEDWYHGRHLGPDPVPEHYHEMTCPGCADRHPRLVRYHRWLKDAASHSGKPDDNGCVWEFLRDIDANKEGSSSKDEAQIGATAALYFDEKWRSSLCACVTCRRAYEEEGISFLASVEDSVAFYEKVDERAGGEASGGDPEAALGNLLGTMDRFQQGELISGYNDMKSNLREYLKKFAENGKVVRAEDIQEFFQDMESKKKMKGGPQYFCG